MSSQRRSLVDSRHGEYRVLHEADLRDYLAALPEVAARLGGAPASWSISEVGDGNLNLVFIVKGAAGGVAVKQALPYVRLVGESWPLPLSRSHYEYLALTHQARLAPGLVPDVLHHNEALALVVMELLEPHIIMRKGLVAGTTYPRFVDDITTFLARTLFLSSDLAVTAAEKKEGIAAFAGNHALCKITEDLIFTDPYRIVEQNRWTQPWLDAIAAAFREDLDLHVAISRLKLKFLNAPEALIHGDLHTGSIMVTESQTKVIDPEFAFYGPMGFDIGAVIANLLMAYLASSGHKRSPGDRRAFEAWVLETVEGAWTDFVRKFLELWRTEAKGDAYPVTLFGGEAGAARLEAERQVYMARLFQDTVGFSAAKIIRRILGLAHNIDFELIEDPKRRAICEARSLRLARAMMVDAASFRTIGAVTKAARDARDWQPDFA
ncbi:S-methyl-5-thioribose kinase [Bradyrhizobium archetypum]|uniref:S-methyl-5-thioribose kinase n=1 Tax=Bradyrhizobium archetypum TaxID=2721160 RepID=A0A7Y4HA19_9BRAD|nr:S-methyl-5-thioribose kinase [Bradyrhizobium archetypum]NOJ49482.1 S-methyl-5-thioribose kinase [Bradyrhizobium archetypum]